MSVPSSSANHRPLGPASNGGADAYWTDLLRRFVTPTPLWFDRQPSRSDVVARTAQGSRAFEQPTGARVSAAAARLGIRAQALVLAAWAVVLSRESGEEDVVFGAQTETGDPCPIRSTVASTTTVTDLAVSIAAQLDACDGAARPAAERLRDLADVPAGLPLFATLVAHRDPVAPALDGPLGHAALVIKVPLDDEGVWRVTMHFDPARIDVWTAEGTLQHLERALVAVVEQPEQRTDEITLLAPEEMDAIRERWAEPLPSFHHGETLHGLFSARAAAAPDAIALVYEERAVTYGEAERRSNQIARRLRAEGVAPGDRVALCVERNPELVLGILGILKAGAAYVPVDPHTPAERLAFIVADSRAPVVVAERGTTGAIPDGAVRVVLLDDEQAADSHPDTPLDLQVADESVAYVIYTSGSTGTPKGVLVTHRNVVRLFHATHPWFGFDEHDVWTLFHSYAFDFSVWEIWGALLYGGRVVVVPYATSRSPEAFHELLVSRGVTVLNQTPSAFFPLSEVVLARGSAELALRYVIFGGEALDPGLLRPWYAHFGERGPTLVNMYGITETTVHVTYRPLAATDLDRRSVIGVPIPDLRLYILDEAMRPVPVGIRGEIFVGGDGVSLGYLDRAELTAARFVSNPFGPGRLYRSGDLARWLPDGDVEYLGRADTQVKVRGFRIELGEIESRLAAHPAVGRAVVVARPDALGDTRLVAYLVAAPGGERLGSAALRAFAGETLPEHMVPGVYVWLDSLPLTGNGKVDLRALPAPSEARERSIDTPYAAPATHTERMLATLWAEVLELERVGIDDGFFDLGGTSRQALRVVARARDAHRLEIPIVRLFEHPTIRALAATLDTPASTASAEGTAERRPVRRRASAGSAEPVAIVGMAARYPGAETVEAFWRNLSGGVESVTFFTDAELDPLARVTASAASRYVAARGVLPDVDKFDAGFFGMTPREAQLMDPQQRLFLELAWQALEHAGYVPERVAAPIGVFAGVFNNSYATTVLSRRPDLVEQYGAFNTMLLNEKDYVATRAAHKLGLTGPALSIHTACSTSLVAICQAVQSLRDGQCGMALAGGVSLTIPTMSGYEYQEGGMLSADGHTRTFDVQAAGTVFSDGAGVVVLKRLDDAERDGDTIYAVLRGVALNNDGANKASFTAPSVSGQAAVIASAHADAEVDARSISYVEAHGTATPLGDPIEVEALTRAFRAATSDVGFCAIGSVKSNIGHTVIAAGVAGVMKTALALRHELIPASLHYTAPNPHLSLATSPFVVASRPTAWPRSATPRRAGVSSFGIGGTNAHVVLEEAPVTTEFPSTRPAHLFVLSARSREALGAAAADLATYLRNMPDAPLADVAYTLQLGRRAFPRRFAIAARSSADAIAQLEARDPRRGETAAPAVPPEVVFMFPGQGSQYVRMGSALYTHEPMFRAAMDRCAEAVREVMGGDLRSLLYDVSDDEAAANALRQTSLTQPALFAIEFALAALWESWGVHPRAMIGHSVGEFVCAVLAGVFSLEDGARLVAVRGRMMQELPPGSMLSVRLPSASLVPRLDPALAIASENAPSLCVVSGPTPLVRELEAALTAEGVACRLLHTSHAFHSSMMDPAVEPLAALVRAIPLAAPRRPFVSSVTGTWITNEQAQDPMYWARHLRETVRFSDGVRTVGASAGLLLELGPRATLATLARQQLTGAQAPRCVASMGTSPDEEYPVALAALGQLWTRGVTPDWAALHSKERRRRVALPTYPFERRRFWATNDGDPREATVVPSAPSPSSIPLADTPPRAVAPESAAPPVPASPSPLSSSPMPAQTSVARQDRLFASVAEILEQVTGIAVVPDDAAMSFVELGFDSLTLTQVALALSKSYGTKVTFRQLLEEDSTMERLVGRLDRELPPDPVETAPAAAPAAGSPAPAAAGPVAGAMPVSPLAAPVMSGSASTSVQWLIDQQLRLMAQQLAVLGGGGAVALQAQPTVPAQPAAQPVPLASADQRPAAPASDRGTAPTGAGASRTNGDGEPSEVPSTGPKREFYDAKKAFGAAPRITHAQHNDLTPKQRARLDTFIKRYTTRTKESKRFTQANRAQMADPRVATGFRPAVKELVYPIVAKHSAGAYLWDLDGNEYLDVLSGFGSNMFGWSAPFVVAAVKQQMEEGFEIGPQHPLTAEVTALVREFTGAERVAFCNTGSEAVLGAIRIARTVTGRNLIVAFSGSYHGINDEVLVRGGKNGRAFPAAPGIMPAATQNMLVLEYGTEASLEVIRSRASEIAAVLVEPVQSRRPDFQPREFLHELRTVTEQAEIVYIWDEIVTGFRTAPGGAQEIFGVRADLATYGKVIGGGLSVGVIAGRREFMDALDGGQWQYGDASVPEVGVTYFAGTFVRHPLALAATRAVLLHLKERGPALQEELSQRTERVATELNSWFASVGAPIEIRRFRSIWKTFYTSDQANGDLLFYMLRERGIHIYDGFPCFMTTAHTDADVERIIAAYKDSVTELQEGGFLPGTPAARQARVLDASAPPVPGARLGRDQDGSPAWFVPNPNARGGFMKVDPA